VRGSVAQNNAQIIQAEQQVVGQITTGTTQAINGANTVIAQVSTGVSNQVTNIGTNFEQGVIGYQDALTQQVNEGNGRASEPVSTLGGRIETAQSRAAERARRSWLENQLADAWDALSDPGFWAGLVVGLVLGVLFIALIAGSALTGGALLFVLVAGFAAIGGIAAGIGSVVGQATNHSFTGGWDWGRVDLHQVGEAMLLGMAAGAAFAVVAFVAVEVFGVAAAGFGMIAIMSVASGVVGIITNVVTGQPWDKGLLFNIFLGGLLTWLGGKLNSRFGGGPRAPAEPNPGGGKTPVPVDPVTPVPVDPVTPVPVDPVTPVPVDPVTPVPVDPVTPVPVDPVTPVPVDPVTPVPVDPVTPVPVEPEPPGPRPVEPVPNSWGKFDPQFNTEFAARLRLSRGNNDLTADPALRGGEGQVFDSPINPLRALKRWFQSRMADMAQSLRLLRDAKAAVDADPNLSQDMEVVEIHEEVNDWILRDFEPDSVPLKSAVSDPEVAAARQRLIDALEGTRDPILRNILGKLRRNSANIHWSPSKNKLIVIDMQ
jgi:hypothetical protein